MLIAARNAMLVESGFTARDYVQDGLIAMWDGIENAGWGVHSDSLPIDLIGGVSLSSAGGIIIGNDSFTAPSSKWLYADIPQFVAAVNNKNFACEIILSGERGANNGIFGLGNTNDRGIWIYGNANYNISTVNIMATGYLEAINPFFASNDRFSISVVGGTSPVVYINNNGTTASYGSLTSLIPNPVCIGNIGRNSSFSSAAKTFYSVRLYNRALTADEIAHNSAIDKARFNLPDAA
ncbi:MAG: hypothetical protein II649_02920 [Kiritimatiellae bacterium]|nr:hypothetical protein [Kiritimatiellia bacterium]